LLVFHEIGAMDRQESLKEMISGSRIREQEGEEEGEILA